jgi:predicted glycosyltransferase involved in capsule biosynthesis
MLIDRSTFLECRGFDESFGHIGEALGGSEEHELLARIRRLYPIS